MSIWIDIRCSALNHIIASSTFSLHSFIFLMSYRQAEQSSPPSRYRKSESSSIRLWLI